MNKSNTIVSNEHVYYNITISNNSLLPIQAEFVENRTTAIVEDPTDYTFSIIRFFIPGQSIPIFNPVLPYSVSFTYAGNIYSAPVVVSKQNTFNNSIVNYTGFLQDINSALNVAFTACKAANLIIPMLTNAPFFVYDPTNQLFSVSADYTIFNGGPSGISLVVPLGVHFYINYNLYTLFSSLYGFLYNYNSGTGLDFNVYIQNLGNNVTGNIAKMSTEVNTQFAWNDLTRILITSGTLNVSNEFVFGGNGNNVSLPILTDFEPLVGGDFRTNNVFQYFPQGPYRRIDLLGHIPLKKIDCKIWYQDKYGNIVPLLIPPGLTVSLKFLFQKKNNFISL